jgi:hypothetical protein
MTLGDLQNGSSIKQGEKAGQGKNLQLSASMICFYENLSERSVPFVTFLLRRITHSEKIAARRRKKQIRYGARRPTE